MISNLVAFVKYLTANIKILVVLFYDTFAVTMSSRNSLKTDVAEYFLVKPRQTVWLLCQFFPYAAVPLIIITTVLRMLYYL